MYVLLFYVEISANDGGMERGYVCGGKEGILLVYFYLLSFTAYMPFIFKLP